MLVLPRRELPRLFTVRSLVTAEDAVRPDGFYFNGEIHDFWEIVYIVDGSAGITADERTFILVSGQMAFHKPMEFHRIWSDKAFHILLLTFYAEGTGMDFFRNKVLSLEPEQILHLLSIEKKSEEVIKCAEQAEKNKMIPQPDLHLTHTVAVELESFLLSLMGTKNVDINLQIPKRSEVYKKIVRTLEEHFNESITLEQLAEICDMSVSGLKKTFKKFTDKSVIAYLNDIKMRYAMLWLKEGVSAAEISDRLGYSDPNYFYVVFKRQTGMTTGEFRSRCREL